MEKNEKNLKMISGIAKNLGITEKQVIAVLEMLEEGNTVPFIARYRKEQTNGLDEEQIRVIEKEFEYKKSLLKRKEDIIRLIDEKGMLTKELEEEILSCDKLVEVEDLYRPFKEKKKTKATEAIKLGLEPLAKIMMSFQQHGNRLDIAAKYITDTVKTAEEALMHARYIISEWISDNAFYRSNLRDNILKYGIIVTKKKKNASDDNAVYEMYYDYQEPIRSIRPHRILAINRAENEGVISVSVEADKDRQIEYLTNKVIKESNRKAIFNADIIEAIKDAHKRLIYPALEREVRAELKDKGENQAIEIFSLNLKNLLLQAPLKGRVILGVDPAFRTGCKLAIVSETGQFLEKGVIYPNELAKGKEVDVRQYQKSKDTIKHLVDKYDVKLIAIGNGTASRETESFIVEVLKEIDKKDLFYTIVSEAGASVYSASELAKDEFPDLEVQERSAISIARRLQDPLSELVKIDPKSIGVGQYQHDVTQSKLEESLDYVVSEAVNKVGVNVNTASVSLLSYVAGLNKTSSKNIIKYRDEVGKFKTRSELKKVSRLGEKTLQQAYGFLRIIDGLEPLDKTSIHPESYEIAYKILNHYNIDPNMLGKNEVLEQVKLIDKDLMSKLYQVDKYTLNDILDAFIAPMRDPRDNYDAPILRSDVLKLEDLKVGMELQGTVRNVVDFGAFIDCGVKYSGLVHISKISKKHIKHPSEVLNVGDLVTVKVLSVDLEKNKLSLTMLDE